MSAAAVPKLRLHFGSSALAISQAPLAVCPPTISYPEQVIHAPPKTDLWRKPPAHDVDNAPTLLISTPIDLHRFHSARVTVSAKWNTLYDQGGIVLFIPDEDTKKFVKTGIEFVHGKPFVSTVAASRWGDWSLVPLPESAGGKVTIEVVREVKDGERVSSLWVNLVDTETGEGIGIREITWWFRNDTLESPEEDDNRRLLVGVYAARPTVPEGEGREKEKLEVKFEEFEVKFFDD